MLAIAAAVPNRALAQSDSGFEVAGGYGFLRDVDGDATFPRGWFASVAGDVAGPISLVGDFGGNYKSMGGLDVELSMSIHTLMGGPRFRPRSARTAPYVQMLFGVARTASTFELPDERLTSARNDFAMTPGGGVDVRLSDRAALRFGANLRLIRAETFTASGSEPFTYKEIQFIAGMVVR